MRRPIRFGILGCARICRRGIIEAIDTSGVSQTAAIASRRVETAARWATEFHIPRSYGSYEELIADQEVDAVYIPLPNEQHAEWTIRAAEAGKHVLCEKPLAMNATEAQQMVDVCQRHGVILMEAFMWRHHPRTLMARRLIKDGAIGELRLVKMDFSFQITPGDWRLEPEHGGGTLYDLCCYGINAARLFVGREPQSVFATARKYRTGVDITTAIALAFGDGVAALCDGSFECPYRNRFEIVGTHGVLELPEGVLPSPETELIVHRAGAGDAVDTERIALPKAQQYTEEVRVFCRSIADGRLLEPAENGLDNMRVLDAARAQINAAWGQ